MDTEAFIRWALDDARTVEDRFTVELLVEQGVHSWNCRRKIYKSLSMDALIERNRERQFNPAYDPTYSEEDLRKAAESLGITKTWSGHSERPIRSVAPFRFLTALESFSLPFHCEVTDFSALAELPALRDLMLGYPSSPLSHLLCEDYTFLARCTALRSLVLGFNARWPDLTGLETLSELESLTLSGNLLAMPRGSTFPNVRRAHLHCMPLAVRNVSDLPRLPACEFLTLFGAQSLDGIELMPALRNLTLLGPFRSFAPLTVLTELTCLKVEPVSHLDPPLQPRDVAPLARLPRLLSFTIGSKVFTPENQCLPDMPRDYSPLAEAPALRELTVRACPPVAMEVSAINAGLLPWDDLFLAPEPRPLPPLRMNVAPGKHQPTWPETNRGPGETGLIDDGLRECEARWVGAYARTFIRDHIGHSDWGMVEAAGNSRSLGLTIVSFEAVEKLPEILDGARQVIARLRFDYVAEFHIALRIPPPQPSPAQKQLDRQFRAAQDEWDRIQRQRDRVEYLERLHQLELKQQQGAEIDPDEFSPTERAPYPERPIAPESDEDDGGEGDDDIAVAKKPDPPRHWLDEDEHPLAANYRLIGRLSLSEVWFLPHQRGLAVHLMQREPDIDLPDEREPET